MINRDKYLIMRNILKCVSEGSKTSTRIIYACRLSNSQRTLYLQSMVEKELVTWSKDYRTTTYEITGKGLQVLEVLNNMYDMCPFIMDEGLNIREGRFVLV